MGMYDNMGAQGGGVDPQLIALLTALAQKQQMQRPMGLPQRPQFNANPMPQQRAPINIAPQGFGPGVTQTPQAFQPSMISGQPQQASQQLKPFLDQMTTAAVMQLIGGQ